MIDASCRGSGYLGLIRSPHTQRTPKKTKAHYALAEMTLTLSMLWLRYATGFRIPKEDFLRKTL